MVNQKADGSYIKQDNICATWENGLGSSDKEAEKNGLHVVCMGICMLFIRPGTTDNEGQLSPGTLAPWGKQNGGISPLATKLRGAFVLGRGPTTRPFDETARQLQHRWAVRDASRGFSRGYLEAETRLAKWKCCTVYTQCGLKVCWLDLAIRSSIQNWHPI
jgi:hypothetical protein